MSTCCSNPEYLVAAAEAALSPRLAEVRAQELFKICCMPPETHGVRNQISNWERCWAGHARRLVWC